MSAPIRTPLSYGDALDVAQKVLADECPGNALIRALMAVDTAARANAREDIGLPGLLAALLPVANAYPDDPGTSDLDDEQPVGITLGDVRRARRAYFGATYEWPSRSTTTSKEIR